MSRDFEVDIILTWSNETVYVGDAVYILVVIHNMSVNSDAFQFLIPWCLYVTSSEASFLQVHVVNSDVCIEVQVFVDVADYGTAWCCTAETDGMEIDEFGDVSHFKRT